LKDIYKLTYNEINSLYSVEGLLRECGAQKIVDKGTYLSFSSPFREDKNPSMVLYKDDLGCVDFAGDFAGSFFSFVKKSTGQNINQIIGVTNEEILNKKYWEGKNEVKNRVFAKDLTLDDFKMTDYEGHIDFDFSKCEAAQKYLDSRFITKEFKEFFNIGYTRYIRIYRSPKINLTHRTLKGTVFEQRICIPIIMSNTTVSIEGRDWTRLKKRKCVYPKGSTTRFLFNYDNLDKTKPLVVVEGIMDTPRIWSFITKNISCLFGNMFKTEQKEQLKEFPKITLLVDMDKGGRQMISNMEKFYEDEFWIAQLPSGDPGDSSNSVQDLEYALTHEISSTEYLLIESELFEETKITTNDFFGK